MLYVPNWRAGQTLHVMSPGSSTFFVRNDVMTAILKVTSNRKSDFVNRCVLREEYSCQILSWSIWNDGALGFFEDGRPSNNKNKMSSDMRSVPDLIINTYSLYLQFGVAPTSRPTHGYDKLLLRHINNLVIQLVSYYFILQAVDILLDKYLKYSLSSISHKGLRQQ